MVVVGSSLGVSTQDDQHEGYRPEDISDVIKQYVEQEKIRKEGEDRRNFVRFLDDVFKEVDPERTKLVDDSMRSRMVSYSPEEFKAVPGNWTDAKVVDEAIIPIDRGEGGLIYKLSLEIEDGKFGIKGARFLKTSLYFYKRHTHQGMNRRDELFSYTTALSNEDLERVVGTYHMQQLIDKGSVLKINVNEEKIEKGFWWAYRGNIEYRVDPEDLFVLGDDGNYIGIVEKVVSVPADD